MTIKIGDRLPAGILSEFVDVETEGCSIGPSTVLSAGTNDPACARTTISAVCRM